MMKKLRNDRFLVLDSEFTCWDGPAPDGMQPDIIEIGVVEAAGETMAETRYGRYLVRPVQSTVSAYCTGLTGISPDDLRRFGQPLPESLRTLAKAFGPGQKRLVTWGADWSALDGQCRRDGVANPFPRDNVVDLAAVVALARGRSDRIGLSGALEMYGLDFDGTPHGAVDDARNTLRLFAEIVRRMAPDVGPVSRP
jgi:inhibitor of KinA sporulation pathway (predicted exonuclease)